MSTPNPVPGNVNPAITQAPDPGHVVIRLDQAIRSDQEDLQLLAQEQGLTELEQFLSSATVRSERVVDHVAPSVIREREKIASRSDFPPLKSLASYWRFDLRHEDDREAVRAKLAAMQGIEIAYHELAVIEATSPAALVASNTYESYQHVLDAAPVGIDARSAWSKTNGMGQGVRVIDVEQAWIEGHEDNPDFEVKHGDNGVLHGVSNGDHGAAALGVVGGQNNDLGIIGVAPCLESLHVVSHYDAKTDTNLHVANAIDAATKHLQPGDILYIEVQRPANGAVYPTEIESADLHAIRHATAQGIIVVEAAGNWRIDLDAWIDPQGEHSLNSSVELYSDSGAIMVGSCHRSVVTDPFGYDGHRRYFTSNYGSRVNCHAWGEMNYSAGYGTLGGTGSSGSTDSYTANFGETSGATAVIAGAAAVLQAWYKSWCGAPLTAMQMRTLLSQPATATKQAFINGEPIGVMPNLDRIMTCRTRLLQILLCLIRRATFSSSVKLDKFAPFKADRWQQKDRRGT